MQNASAPVTGEFTVGFENSTTAALSWGATAADLRDALAASMGDFGRGLAVSVEGDPLLGFNYSVTFGG